MATIVLITRGKWEQIYEARVLLFNNYADAAECVSCTNDPEEKYWVRAQIVEEGAYVTLKGKGNAH